MHARETIENVINAIKLILGLGENLVKHFPQSRRAILCISLFLSLIVSTTITGVNAQLPYVYVDPPSVQIQAVGQTVMVNVTVFNVTGLYGWDVRLNYNSTLLNMTSATEYGTNSAVGAEPHTWTDVSVAGSARVGCAFSEAGGAVAFDGTGVLAFLTFQGNMLGISNLTFVEFLTLLYDSEGGFIPKDPSVGGEIEVIPEFPPSVAVTLLLIATLAAAFLGKTLWPRKRKATPLSE